MIRPSHTLLAAGALAAALLAAAPALAQVTDPAAFRTTTLNLGADASVTARPDIVTLMLGVTGEAATATAASTRTGEEVNAVVRALLRAGVAQRDIQTRYANLSAVYSDASNRPRDIVAYRAETTVSVTLRDIERADAMMDLAIGSGANQVQGVRFGLSDPAIVQRLARDAALKALQHDAGEVAEAMGQRVVRLVNVRTDAYATAVPVVAHRIEEFVPPGSRLNAGELTIRGSASGVFELAPR